MRAIYSEKQKKRIREYEMEELRKQGRVIKVQRPDPKGMGFLWKVTQNIGPVNISNWPRFVGKGTGNEIEKYIIDNHPNLIGIKEEKDTIDAIFKFKGQKWCRRVDVKTGWFLPSEPGNYIFRGSIVQHDRLKKDPQSKIFLGIPQRDKKNKVIGLEVYHTIIKKVYPVMMEKRVYDVGSR